MAQWYRIYQQCRRRRFDTWVGKIRPEEEMVAHSSILTLEIPLTKKPGRPLSTGVTKESDMT